MSATDIDRTSGDLGAPDDAVAPLGAQTRGESAGAERSRGASWLPAVAFLLLAASLFGPLAQSGIWDPFELRVAELSRRIALTLLGASNLSIEGSTNTVPTLGELSRGQLPFTSIALGFKLFGLHEWAGRLPLAIWGMVGALSTYALVSRLVDRIAGAFAVLALATMPLYFLHSRTMLGDIVTMSSIAMAAAGLGLAIFDAESSAARRVAWLLLGLVGLAAGFGARGVLLGVVPPSLGVGITWLLLRSRLGPQRLAHVVGALTLALGLFGVFLGLRALGRATAHPTDLSLLLGASVKPPKMLPTYDAVVHYLGHGLFPWSAVVPFAVGRLLRPPHGVAPSRVAPETALRVMAMLIAAVAFGAHGLVAPTVGLLPYVAVCMLAVIAALALRDFDRGAPGSRALAMGVAALAILLYYDFKNFPEKGLSAFVVEDPRFPESFKESAHRLLKVGTLIMIGGFGAAFMESTDRLARRFDREEYWAWPRALRTLWSGNLWFTVLVAEAALVGYAALTWLSKSQFHWKQFEQAGPLARQVATWGYLGLPLLVLLPVLGLLARDVLRELFLRIPLSRATVAACSVAASGAVFSLGYYPKLAAQISPKEVFDAYRKHAKPGESLGIVGVGTGAAAYYAGRNVPAFDNANAAFNWLTDGTERRWLVLRSADLPQLNSLHRALPSAPGNVPVLDARSSEIMLLSNRLEAGEKNENPFSSWVLDQAPNPRVRMDANLAGQLDVIGWEVTDLEGRPVDSVVPQKQFQFRTYYKVVAAISGNWETFIHIDGFQRRFNGDHQTLENKYAFHLWRVGDYMVDVYPFSLEPNFTPGDYEVFFGLFIGSRRLEVKRGRHNDNRLEAGRLRVR